MDESQRKNTDTVSDVSPGSLLKTALVNFAATFLILGAALFLSAGTIQYWQAWLYLTIIIISTIITAGYVYLKKPRLLERRIRMRETRRIRQIAIVFFWIFILSAFIIPGFDKRFHWSDISAPLIIICLFIVLFGYLIMALSFIANSYIWKIVKAEKGQKVISTGPYFVVRHPLYSGAIIFCIFSPLALGSYWAVIPALFLVPSLVCRVMGEEKDLAANLDEYKKYMEQTRYRLIPGIW